MNEWEPVEDYETADGRVIVWLSWPQYSQVSLTLEPHGMFQMAYRMPLSKGAVWVGANDCIPIETKGHKVTHFMRPLPPQAIPHD